MPLPGLAFAAFPLLLLFCALPPHDCALLWNAVAAYGVTNLPSRSTSNENVPFPELPMQRAAVMFIAMAAPWLALLCPRNASSRLALPMRCLAMPRFAYAVV